MYISLEGGGRGWREAYRMGRKIKHQRGTRGITALF